MKCKYEFTDALLFCFKYIYIYPLLSLIEDVTYRVGRLVISLGSKGGKGANEMSYEFK